MDAGYDRVITVFADERLMERTIEAMGSIFSEGEMARVRLVPLSKMGGWCNTLKFVRESHGERFFGGTRNRYQK